MKRVPLSNYPPLKRLNFSTTVDMAKTRLFIDKIGLVIGSLIVVAFVSMYHANLKELVKIPDSNKE